MKDDIRIRDTKDYYWWIVLCPDGWVCGDSFSATRSESIRKFFDSLTYAALGDSRTWPELRRDGWRCIKVRLVPVKEGP
jgi:hypothetical protein